MRLNSFRMKYGLMLVVFPVILLCCPAYAGEPFLPETGITIETRYARELQEVMGERVVWQVSSRVTENGFVLEYRIAGKQLFCTLGVDRSGPVMGFTLTGSDRKTIDAATGAFIPFAGFPVPCRIFEIIDFTRSGSFDLLREAGGRKFLEKYSYDTRTVSWNEAVENRWVGPEQQGSEKDRDLVLISVKNAAEETLFSQLWEKDSAWWLFEETEHSRSWKRE